MRRAATEGRPSTGVCSAIVAPAGTPDAVVNRLKAEINES